MRILVLTTSRRDTAEVSIASALSTAHEVETFDYEKGRRITARPALRPLNSLYQQALKAFHKPITYLPNRALLRWIEGKRFDLVVIVPITLVPADVIEALRRRTGAFVLGWFTDHIVNLDGADFVNAPYDRIFFKDKIVVDRFRQGTASDRYDFLPQAFDPLLHRPVPARLAPRDAEVDVATFGNSYPFRAMLMAPLIADRSVRTTIYGAPSWNIDPALRAIYRPEVFSLEKSAAMRAAKIALNTNQFAELGGVNKRSFELGAMGAFHLTDGPRIEDYYVPGEECATFHGPDELLEKVRYYLPRAEERAAIARRGLARAWRDHTYHTRLNECFERIPAFRSAAKLPVPKGPPEPEDRLSAA
ncbi:MAG: glycosyltransferase [Byssovorax sp.]